MKQIKQGHTRFRVHIFAPGEVVGYENQFVAMVFRCFVVKRVGNCVLYTDESSPDRSDPYMCSKTRFAKYPDTFRKALRLAKARIGAIEASFEDPTCVACLECGHWWKFCECEDWT